MVIKIQMIVFYKVKPNLELISVIDNTIFGTFIIVSLKRALIYGICYHDEPSVV